MKSDNEFRRGLIDGIPIYGIEKPMRSDLMGFSFAQLNINFVCLDALYHMLPDISSIHKY